jgi:DNA-binding response OmpR family regulator
MLDLTLPRMEGLNLLTAAREIRSNDWWRG